MKTAVIAGATGLVGSSLLQKLLEQDAYAKVIALLRKPINLQHPKLEQKIVDFGKPETFDIQGDDFFSCLGTTIAKAGSQEVFKQVDLEYPKALALMAKAKGYTGFYLISAVGASASSTIFYSRVKGQLDDFVQQLGFEKLGIFRPSMLLGKRSEFRMGEFIAKYLMLLFHYLTPLKYRGIEAKRVAKCMIFHALNGSSGNRIIENAEMLKMKC
jgi:uncharacterized protein YbjT (DUF2867 family)